MKKLKNILRENFKPVSTLLSGLLFVGACSLTPSARGEFYSSFDGFVYTGFYKIPDSNYYVAANSSKNHIAQEKAAARARDLGLHEFSEEDFKKVDKNKNQVIEFEEEKKLFRNKYSEEQLRRGVYKKGTYVGGKLVK